MSAVISGCQASLFTLIFSQRRSPRSRFPVSIPRGSLRKPAATISFFGLLTVSFLWPLQDSPARAAALQQPLSAGLYFNAGRDDAAVEAPTLASDVEIAVSGLVARVTVRQHFVNPTSVWLEGLYVFPLPERSAVDRLVMTVGERRIEGEIMEREAARKTYEKAKAEGKRAGLLAAERANVFTTSVANIGPGDEVVIEIEYQDRVAYRDGVFQLRFPMVVAPRYTPGGPPLTVRAPEERGAPAPQPVVAPPGEGRDLFGPVRDPARGPINPLTLTVELDAGLPLAEVTSLYHPVAVETHDPRRRTITLREGSVPAKRDFVLEWTPEPSAAPEAAVFGEEIEGASYLSVLVVPPARTDDATPRPPRDLILVVDTSGSMHGASIAQAKAAIGKALGRLAPDDRFNVIRFDSRTDSLFADARLADPGNLRAAARYVAAFEAEGGTEMMPALVQALAGRAESGRLRQVVFLTDGAVSNEDRLFQVIDRMLGGSRLFTVGIGSAPNSHFMREAAVLGRGSFTYIGDLDEVSERMAALFRKLERPALTDLVVDWPAAAGDDVESYPAPLPDLYDGEPVVFSARLGDVPLEALGGALTVTGRRGGETWRRELALDAIPPAAGVAAIWARAKLQQIENGLARGADPDAVREAALAVALPHRLVTRYTSLVAVDNEPVRPAGTDLHSREIERNLPAGWDYAKVFGEATGPDGAPLRLRTLPPDLMRKISANAPGQSVALPQTATPATLHALAGLILLLLGTVLVLAWRRMARGAAHS